MTVKAQHIYYDLLLQGYMFRLRRKFERYCFFVRSTKNLTFININVTIHLALHNNFVFTDGDKKCLACTVRASNKPTQDYLIPSALWDPIALTIVGVIVL